MLKRMALCAAVLTLTGTALFAAGQPDAAPEARQFVLRFNHVLAPTHPYQQGFLNWAEAVARRTNGNLRIEVFPSAQLGVEEDILEQIRQGAAVGQNTDAARLGTFVPEMAVVNAPFFVESFEEVQKLSALPTVQAWMAELERTQGFKVLSFYWAQGFRQMITNKPIRTPADLTGLRIRTPPAPIWQESIRAIGATPVAMAFGEMYAGMQTRAIDGVEITFTNAWDMKFFELAKYASETKHIFLVNFQVVSSQWFNSLPEAYQKILVEEANKAGTAVSQGFAALDARNLASLQAAGMTLIPASEIDMAAFRAAGEGAYRRLNLLRVRDRLYREMGKTR